MRVTAVSQKLIIDADPGIGDAIAVALALIDPDLEVVGLTATSGQVAGAAATHNLQAVTALLDPDRLPRFGDCERPATPIPKERGTPHPLLLHGPSGLGECDVPVASLHQRHESAKLLAELVRQEPHQLTLLTLGPLTNVQLALDWHPEFFEQLKALVCLGGSVGVGGDVTAAAEFNVYSNPEAARAVLTYPATKTLVPLDVARQLMVSFDQYQRWELEPTSRLGRLLHLTLPFALRASRQHLGLEGVRLPEVVALAAVSQPQLFQRDAMCIDVELGGELTRGATVFDRRATNKWQTNIDVLTDVEVQGVIDYVSRVIRSAV
jgi:inosine-uridine nucleoside N-ribohydrolase